MNWYTLRVISGKESKIRENLLYELDMQNLSNEVGDVLVPSENIVEMKEGKKKIKNKVFFPRYILINMSDLIHFSFGPIAIINKNGIKNGIINL